MIMVKDNLIVQHCTSFLYNRHGISCQSIIVYSRSQNKVRIVNVYRPPRVKEANDIEFLDFIEHSLSSTEEPTILVGDLNIDWLTISTGIEAKYRKMFVNDLSFTQYVSKPTHNQKVIDVVLSNSEFVHNVNTLAPLANSDHNSIHYEIHLSDTNPIDITLSVPRPCFAQTNFASMKNLLTHVCWEELFDLYTSIDDLYERFCSVIHGALSLCTPMQTIKRRTSLPLYIRKLMRYRNQLFDRCNTPYVKDKFISISEKLNKKIKQFKIYSEQKMIKSCSSKILFRFINNRLKPQKNGNIPTLFDDNGRPIVCDAEKAELLSNYFSTVFVKDDHKLPTLNPNNNSKLNTFLLMPFEVEEVLKALSPTLSTPSDGIPQDIYRTLHNELSLPLSYIFNLSLFSGEIPKKWKMSIITPVPKISNPSQCSHFRPIAITCPPSKVLETLVKRRIDTWIESNNILPPEQFGFRSSHSTIHQLLASQNYIVKGLNSGKNVDAIYYDVSKAFDSVSHQKLLFILKQLGLGGCLIAWIESFLVNREFCVKVKNTFSSWNPVTSGVPQGSVLGPLFFILYIFDLPDKIRSGLNHIAIYADDIKTISAFDNYSEDLENTIEKLFRYMSDRQLQLSAEKTKVVHYGSHNPTNFYALGDRIIESTTCVRDLGVFIDSKLSYKQHIERKVQVATHTMFALLKSFHSINSSLLIMLFKSIVLPKLLYASPVWFPAKIGLISQIEKVQKTFTMIVYCRKHKVSPREVPDYESRCKLFKLKSIEHNAIVTDLKMLKDILDNKTPLYPSQVFLFSRNHTQRSNKTLIQVPLCKCSAAYNSFFVRTSRWTTKLPQEFYSEKIDFNYFAQLINNIFS